MFAIPSVATYIRKSIGLLPDPFRAFSVLCEVLQHLWVYPIEEIVVILELINLFQFFLAEGLSIAMHLIGLPFCWVFVTVGNQAAVVPNKHALHMVKQITCCHRVLLIFQLQLHLVPD